MAQVRPHAARERLELRRSAQRPRHGERMKRVEQRAGELVLRANGRGRREQHGEERREGIACGSREERLVRAEEQDGQADRVREQRDHECPQRGAQANFPNQRRPESEEEQEKAVAQPAQRARAFAPRRDSRGHGGGVEARAQRGADGGGALFQRQGAQGTQQRRDVLGQRGRAGDEEDFTIHAHGFLFHGDFARIGPADEAHGLRSTAGGVECDGREGERDFRRERERQRLAHAERAERRERMREQAGTAMVAERRAGKAQLPRATAPTREGHGVAPHPEEALGQVERGEDGEERF